MGKCGEDRGGCCCGREFVRLDVYRLDVQRASLGSDGKKLDEIKPMHVERISSENECD